MGLGQAVLRESIDGEKWIKKIAAVSPFENMGPQSEASCSNKEEN